MHGPTASPPGEFRLGHAPALDGLRAVAVLAVMFGHLSLVGAGANLGRMETTLGGLRGGFLGVDVFFVLSGFLITTLLVQEQQRTGRIRLRAFYARRVLRLLPALAVLLAACCLFVAWRGYSAESRPVARGVVLGLGCAVNTYFCVKTAHVGMLTHLWSLSLEEQFYFLWPVLLWGLLRWRVRRRWVVLAVLAALAASAALRHACWWSGTTMAVRVAVSSLPTRAENLLLGALLALVLCWVGLPRSAAGRVLVAAAAWGGAALLAGVLWWGVPGPGVHSLAGVASALLIAGLVAGPARPLRTVLAAAPCAWLGRVSYGLYLWHPPIFCLAPLVLYHFLGRGAAVVRLGCAAAFVLSLAAAAASYYLVERPFLRWKTRWSPA
jgi:peptidoglycan/LPS O-acetylase OafA/YrhL